MASFQNDFENLVFLLRNRPGMILGDDLSYKSFSTFLRGYEMGLISSFKFRPKPFSHWLESFLERSFALNPYDYISEHIKVDNMSSQTVLINYFSNYVYDYVIRIDDGKSL